MADEIQQNGTVDNAPAADAPTGQSVYSDSTVPIEQAPASTPDAPAADGSPEGEGNTDVVADILKSLEVPEPGQRDPTPAVTPAPEAKPTAPGQPRADYRDYSGLNEEDKKIFQRMYNEAFNKLKPLYLEHVKTKKDLEERQKELAEVQGRHFYEQENAYTLVPEYQSISANISHIGAELAHWKRQLSNIENGQPWYNLGRDDKGNVGVVPTPIPITQENIIEARTNILDMLSRGHAIHEQLNSKLTVFQEKFKGEHKSYLSSFDEMEKNLFPGADPVKLAAAAKVELANFPLHMRGRREVQSFAKTIVIVKGLLGVLNQRAAANGTQQAIAKTAQSGSPSADSIQPGGGKGDTVADAWAEFADLEKRGFQAK